jgi:hypothetical protein
VGTIGGNFAGTGLKPAAIAGWRFVAISGLPFVTVAGLWFVAMSGQRLAAISGLWLVAIFVACDLKLNLRSKKNQTIQNEYIDSR